jgi:hypothetical protein
VYCPQFRLYTTAALLTIRSTKGIAPGNRRA